MTERPLAGRVAVVTGAGQGVGQGIAAALAERGAAVVLAARRAETGEPAAETIRRAGGDAVCIVTDVTRGDDMQHCVSQTVDRYGALHIMVHNAFRGAQLHRVEDVDDDLWTMNSRTAVWGSYYAARYAAPHLRAAGSRGRLVLVTSPAGIEGSVTLPVYASVKAAQRAIAKSLAREWGPDGVTVNCLAPVAETPALAGAFAQNPALKERLAARTALRRIGDAEHDVGAVAAFLASDDGGYVTGQTVVCDGGSFIGL